VAAGHGKTQRIWSGRREKASPTVLGDGRRVGVDPELTNSFVLDVRP
jgi:hypothetical protein